MSIDIKLHKKDLPDDFKVSNTIAIDCEMGGLNINRDPLFLVQISSGNLDAHIVQLNRENYKAPKLLSILEDNKVKKIFHYARADLGFLKNYLNANIENVTKKISLDDLTNLSIRQTYETDMKKMFISKHTGYVLSVKINNLGEFAKNNNNSNVDKFIKEFANILKNSNQDFEFKISAYRFFGSEFAMILENANNKETKQLSSYLKTKFDELGKNIPKPNLAEVEAEIWALTDVIDASLVHATHDISDGGVAVALAEMSFENEIGFEIEIEQDMRTDQWLFSQTGGFILEADNINIPAIISIMSGYGIPVTELGRTTAHQVMVFGNVIHVSLAKVKESWHGGLRDKLK